MQERVEVVLDVTEVSTIGEMQVVLAMLEAKGAPKTATLTIEKSSEVIERNAATLKYRHVLKATATWPKDPLPAPHPDAGWTPFHP